MLITILGTRGNVESTARRYSRHSGILVDGLILLHVGESEYLKRYTVTPIPTVHSQRVAAHDGMRFKLARSAGITRKSPR